MSGISIHALLAESDEHTNNSANTNLHFYPRSPCGERQLDRAPPLTSWAISIHALLAESDDISFYANYRHLTFLSTLSLRRATYLTNYQIAGIFHFYPRSPCGERRAMAATITPTYEFLSTLSLRRATEYVRRCPTNVRYFYPRSPCGERLHGFLRGLPKEHLFLSTLSLRRATLRLMF